MEVFMLGGGDSQEAFAGTWVRQILRYVRTAFMALLDNRPSMTLLKRLGHHLRGPPGVLKTADAMDDEYENIFLGHVAFIGGQRNPDFLGS